MEEQKKHELDRCLDSLQPIVYLESPARVTLIFANHLPAEPKFSHSPSAGEAAEAQGLTPWEILHLSVHWPYYCANSVLILVPSILSWPWAPRRSCRGGIEMGIISCS